mmetsp:Transcript_74750/g.207854  ORF Transcript_74750/g.207854 Transcript_74750/m.207854 type:complete len:213 (+) Transcript_74750:484-1122(+)
MDFLALLVHLALFGFGLRLSDYRPLLHATKGKCLLEVGADAASRTLFARLRHVLFPTMLSEGAPVSLLDIFLLLFQQCLQLFDFSVLLRDVPLTGLECMLEFLRACFRHEFLLMLLHHFELVGDPLLLQFQTQALRQQTRGVFHFESVATNSFMKLAQDTPMHVFYMVLFLLQLMKLLPIVVLQLLFFFMLKTPCLLEQSALAPQQLRLLCS